MLIKKGETEEEQSTFQRLSQTFKQGLYGGFYALLQGSEQTSLLKFIIVHAIVLLQLLSYSFNSSVRPPHHLASSVPSGRHRLQST